MLSVHWLYKSWSHFWHGAAMALYVTCHAKRKHITYEQWMSIGGCASIQTRQSRFRLLAGSLCSIESTENMRTRWSEHVQKMCRLICVFTFCGVCIDIYFGARWCSEIDKKFLQAISHGVPVIGLSTFRLSLLRGLYYPWSLLIIHVMTKTHTFAGKEFVGILLN